MINPPRAQQRITEKTHHGIKSKDEYAWLKSDNWRDIIHGGRALPENIRAHLEAENQYAAHIMHKARSCRQTLLHEMQARIPPNDKSVPEQDGDYFYYEDFVSAQEHPRICRTRGAGGAEDIMLDGNVEAKTHDFFKIGAACHSPDHQKLAWSADSSGGEYYIIYRRDLATKKDAADIIPASDGSIIWSADSQYVFYIHMDENHRPCEVRRHKIATDPAQDDIIWRETNPGYFLSLDKTQSEDYILINSYDHSSSEVYFFSAYDAQPRPRLAVARRDNVEYALEHDRKNKRFIILTNDNARDFKIAAASEDDTSQWQDIIPAREGVYILDMNLYENHLVWLVRENVLPRLMIQNLSSGKISEMDFGDEPHDLDMSAGLMYQAGIIRIHYSSMRQPEQTYDLNMDTGEKTLRKTEKIPGGHKADDYKSEQIFAKAEDGALIPISLFYHARTPPKDGGRPLLLYGYGAYGITIAPYFSSARLSLVNRGFTFAIAHIRGGAAKGRGWYEQGKLQHKKNSFTDFIAASDHLIRAGYAQRGNITAHGGSAGGMLMGAVANMAPSLFRAIIAQVPFVDVLATMLDAELPLTPPEWLEWGNPIASKTAYQLIASYSPYDNVRPQAYPWIFATSGLTDPRVGYWEAAKWIARLRPAQQGDAPIILKTEMSAGHAGQSGRFRRLKEIAEIYSFILLAHNMLDEQNHP